MKKIAKDPYVWIFLVFAFYPMLPYIGNFTSLGTELLLWFIFTLSFNLCLGYTGLPSFGHGAFYGLGCYGAALAFLRLFDHSGFVLPLVVAIMTGGVFAALLGYIIRNKKGVFFALLTVVFTQVLFSVCWRWDKVTGGESGLMGISRTSFLGLDLKDPISFYYLVFVIFVLCALLIRTIANSSFGMSLKAIRQNPVRAMPPALPMLLMTAWRWSGLMMKASRSSACLTCFSSSVPCSPVMTSCSTSGGRRCAKTTSGDSVVWF